MRVKSFFKTALIGGILSILPLATLIIIFRWIIGFVGDFLHPIVNMFNTDSQWVELAIYAISIVSILFLFFAIGLFIQTSFGKITFDFIERRYLSKIIGYRTIKEIVIQVFGGNKKFFSEVVLVDVFNSGTLMTGFITDHCEQSQYVTVFIPTGPNPTSGNIYHVKEDKVQRTEISVDVALKTIISCGSGSSAVLEKRVKKR